MGRPDDAAVRYVSTTTWTRRLTSPTDPKALSDAVSEAQRVFDAEYGSRGQGRNLGAGQIQVQAVDNGLVVSVELRREEHPTMPHFAVMRGRGDVDDGSRAVPAAP